MLSHYLAYKRILRAVSEFVARLNCKLGYSVEIDKLYAFYPAPTQMFAQKHTKHRRIYWVFALYVR